MIEFGDDLLKRDGALVRAVRQRYRQMTADNPELASFMRDCGRARELT
jgi:hypothetical protein